MDRLCHHNTTYLLWGRAIPLGTRDAYVSKNAPKALFSMTQIYFTLSSVNSQAFGLEFFVNIDYFVCRLQEKYRHDLKHQHSCTIAAATEAFMMQRLAPITGHTSSPPDCLSL